MQLYTKTWGRRLFSALLFSIPRTVESASALLVDRQARWQAHGAPDGDAHAAKRETARGDYFPACIHNSCNFFCWGLLDVA